MLQMTVGQENVAASFIKSLRDLAKQNVLDIRKG